MARGSPWTEKGLARLMQTTRYGNARFGTLISHKMAKKKVRKILSKKTDLKVKKLIPVEGY
jgi:hypothetical protein